MTLNYTSGYCREPLNRWDPRAQANVYQHRYWQQWDNHLWWTEDRISSAWIKAYWSWSPAAHGSCKYLSHILTNYDLLITWIILKMIQSSSKFQADVDGNGTIDYIEFITATMHRHKLERDEHLYKAFQYFDKDSSG